MNAYLSYVIPILTFALGALLTFFWKRHDKRNATIATYARELSDSANEWYNQIYELKIAEKNADAKEFERKADYYIKNRLVLPKYLRALNALRKYEEAHPVVLAGENMLKLLTTMRQDQSARVYDCRVCMSVSAAKTWTQNTEPKAGKKRARVDRHHRSALARVEAAPIPHEVKPPKLDELVSLLDSHVQTISVEAGRIV